MRTKSRLLAGAVVVVVLALGTSLLGCSSSSGSDDDAAPAGDEALSGITRPDPLQVGDVTVPDATTGGAGGDFAMAATSPDELLIAYFGYTSCPDICPTTLADLRTAFEQVGAEAERATVAMVTVDPERDTGDKLSNYLSSFFSDYRALRQPDLDLLAAAEAPFGARSSVVHNDDGTVDVSHTAITYVVDDRGEVLVEWPFGTEPDAMADDLTVLLDRSASAT